MLHEFEEIIFVPGWVAKHRNNPKINQQYWIKTFTKYSVTSKSFSILIAEEFVIASILTIIAVLLNLYPMIIGLFISYALHLIMHILSALQYRRYVPGAPSSVITLPIILWMLFTLVEQTGAELMHVIIWALIFTVGLILNLAALYRITPFINKLIK